MFLGETLRVFHHCSFKCFHFTIDFYYCFRTFSLLTAFVHFTVSWDVFLWPTFFTVTVFFVVFFLLLRFLYCCTASAMDLREHLFLLGVFYFTLLPNIWYKLLLSRLPWGWQFHLKGCGVSHWGSKYRPYPSVCLNHTVFCNCNISRELCLYLSKYVDKLLVAKSLINF